MELINGVPRNKDGLIFELMAKYPPYFKGSDIAKWPRVDGRLSGRFNANDLTSSFTGTNRTVTDASGLQITLPASVPSIDHIDNALIPTIRLEPAAANILLEVLTDWTDTTLTPVKNAVNWAGAANGAYTVTASGANGTLISAAVSASSVAFTFVCAIKRSVGTGAVYMTIDNGATWTEKTLTTSFQYFNVTKTAANPQLGFKLATSGDAIIVDMLALIPNTAIASSSFTPAAAIGAELVTDGGFAAVTVGATEYAPTANCTDPLNDQDVTTGWTPTAGTCTLDSVAGGETGNCLELTYVTGASQNATGPALNLTIGKCYKLIVKIKSGTAGNKGFSIAITKAGVGNLGLLTGTSSGSWVAYSTYMNMTSDYTTGKIYLQKTGGDAGTMLFDDITLNEVTFTSWTAGTGWAPQATANVLTGKAQKIAGTASDLTQTATAAEAGKVYRVGNTAVCTAGTLTPEFGSTDGAIISANGTYYDYPIAADTDYIKFKADSSFAGSVDVATVKEHGTVRLSEANTTTLAIPADVSTMLAAGTGTIVIKGRFAFARAAGVITNILASAAATNSLIYTTTAVGNITSNDGTTIAENTGAYTANTDWKIALKFPSDTDKYRIGIDVAGAGIVWGTEVAFDGAFTATANLILGYVLHGATWIKYLKIYDKVLTDAQINAL